VEPVEQSSMTAEQQGDEELDHRDPVNSQKGKNALLLPYHPVFKETSSTARTRIAFVGGVKPSNGTQQHNWWVLPMDRFFHWTQGPLNKWKTSVGNSRQHSEETFSAIWRHMPSQSNPADLTSIGIEPSTLPHHGGRDHTSHHRSYQADLQQSHYYRQPGNQKCTCCASTTSRSHLTKTFQVEQLISQCIPQKIHHQLQTSQGQQPLCPHKILTRLWLAVWRWYNRFLIHMKRRNGWNNTRLHSPFLSAHYIHSLIRKAFSQGEDDDNCLHFLIKQCIRWFATKSSLHKIGCLSRTHKVSSSSATTNSLITWEIWIPRIRNSVKTVIHKWLTCYMFKEQTTQQLVGSYHPLESNPRGHSSQLASATPDPSHYDWEQHAARQ